MELFSEGAEAKIYTQKVFGRILLFKRREPKTYRVAQLDEKLRKTRTKREAKVMLRANSHGITAPRLIATGKFTICMEFIKGKLMKDTQYGTDAAAQAGRLLAKLHNQDIAHGDFTTANIIMSNGKAIVIDFGLSEVTKSTEAKAMDILLMKRSINGKYLTRLISSYKSEAKSSLTLSKLADIEKRGRYKIRTLATD